jgi:hypothetical protein
MPSPWRPICTPITQAKGLEQLLAMAAVVAQIGDDQRIAVMVGTDLRQRTGPVAAIERCGNSVNSVMPRIPGA